MDFTFNMFEKMNVALRSGGYDFQTMLSFIERPKMKVIIVRHDVDRFAKNSLKMAYLERSLGIRSTYYFRAARESWDEGIIREIASLGHEIGYHYESLTTCKGNFEKAFDDFKSNLEKLRKLAAVSTICMHGSPQSPWDSRDMWKVYDYRSLGIVSEPYINLDFSKVLYLTDTGRRWDGWKVNIRDKMAQQQEWIKQGLVFRSTWDIVRKANQGTLPDKIMITIHPQRWTNQAFPWIKELVWQNCKNIIKGYIVRRKIMRCF